MESGARSTFIIYLTTLSEEEGGHTVFPHSIDASATDAPEETVQLVMLAPRKWTSKEIERCLKRAKCSKKSAMSSNSLRNQSAQAVGLEDRFLGG